MTCRNNVQYIKRVYRNNVQYIYHKTRVEACNNKEMHDLIIKDDWRKEHDYLQAQRSLNKVRK